MPEKLIISRICLKTPYLNLRIQDIFAEECIPFLDFPTKVPCENIM